MLKIFVLLAGLVGITARLNEYVPLLDTEEFLIQHVDNSSLPQSYSWSDVDGVNYLTKNLNQHIRFSRLADQR